MLCNFTQIKHVFYLLTYHAYLSELLFSAVLVLFVNIFKLQQGAKSMWVSIFQNFIKKKTQRRLGRCPFNGE